MFLLCLEFQFIKGWVNLFLFSLMKIIFDLFSFLIQVVTELQEKKKKKMGSLIMLLAFLQHKVWLDKACGTKSCAFGDKLQVRYEPPGLMYCPHVPISVTIPVIIIC